MLFLKAFFKESYAWETLGGFTVKQRRIGKENLYFTDR